MCCEFMVLLHGPLIALGRGGGAGMFGFGFTIVFLVTGQWGLPLKWYWRASFFVIFVTTCLLNYGYGWSAGFKNKELGFKDMHEITRIPFIYYFIMAVYFMYWLCVRWIMHVKNRTAQVVLAVIASIVGAAPGFAIFVAIVGTN